MQIRASVSPSCSPRRRCSSSFVALAIAGAGLAACGSPPTAPTPGSASDPAPPVTASASAASLTIKITEGTLALVSGVPGSVMLKGSHGFRFDGRVQSGLEPSAYCGPSNPCQPGATVPFTATWVGTDMPGTGRVQGTEFVTSLNGPSMYIELRGSFVAPAHLVETTSVTVPFTASGLLFLDSAHPQLQLTGDGRVTFTLTWQPAIDGWAITHTSFDFRNGRD